MTTMTVDYLVDEVLEFLDAGPVGLYEFIDMQRESDDSVELEVARANATAALDRLLRDRHVQLVWQRWADGKFVRPAQPTDVDMSAWAGPTDEPYLAVMSTDG